MRRFAAVLSGVLASSAVGWSADWLQFRGPGGNGIAPSSSAPTEWSADKNVSWKSTVAGVAWSCPIVVGDKIILTTAFADGQPKPRSGGGGGFGRPGGGGGPPGAGGGRPPGGGGFGRTGGPDKEYAWRIVCLNQADGKIAWEKTMATAKPKYNTHASNTFATETPVSDGRKVFVYLGSAGVVAAFDLTGKEVWKKDLGMFPTMMGWGTASSPALHDGLLFIQCDNEEKSFLTALDAETGTQKWKINREEKTNWATPYVWKTKDRTDLVVAGSRKLTGYDPANGKEVWTLAVGGGQCNASPVADGDYLYFGTGMGGGGGGGFGRPGGGAPGAGGPPGGGGRPGMGGGGGGTLFAVKAGATGDITPKEGKTSSDGIAWSAPRSAPGASSPILFDGKLYTFDRQGGTVSCFDAKTGKADYTKERIPNAKAFWSSPWMHGDKIFCMDEDGVTHVIKPGSSFEVLGKNTLGKDVYWSTPAVTGDRIIVRGVDTVYCIK